MSQLTIKDSFSVTPNSLLNNPDISLKAKGLYAFMQGKPNGWKFSVERMAAQLKEGEKAIRNALHELGQAGYLSRIPIKADGQFQGYNYILYSSPQPLAKTPSVQNARVQKGISLSKKEVVKNIKDKDLQKQSPPENPFLKEKDFKDLKVNGADEDGSNDAAITAAFRVYEQELGVKMGTALRVWSRPFVILILKDHTVEDIRNAIQNWAAVIKSEGKQPAQFINFKSLAKMIDIYKNKKKVRQWR